MTRTLEGGDADDAPRAVTATTSCKAGSPTMSLRAAWALTSSKAVMAPTTYWAAAATPPPTPTSGATATTPSGTPAPRPTPAGSRRPTPCSSPSASPPTVSGNQ